MKSLHLFTCTIAIFAITACTGTSKKVDTNTETQPQTQTTSTASSTIPSNNMPSVIDFSATWCGPCKQFAPIFDAANQKFSKTINFVKIDIDENTELTQQYGVESIPTVIFLSADGKEINRTVGLITQQELETNINALTK
ncbi:MAG: thioredoxin [Muribaculaceae bacterium]